MSIILPILLESLSFCSRDRLEELRLVCQMLNSMVKHYFPSKPCRFFNWYYLHIDMSTDGKDVRVRFFCHGMHGLSLPQHMIKMSARHETEVSWNPTTQQWQEGESWFELDRMHASLQDKCSRVMKTNIFISQAPYTAAHVAKIATLSHLWDGQRLDLKVTSNEPAAKTSLFKYWLAL
uniref:F-box domain-containing protein n=1 Tax=Ditylenchus dipsaci TaxID=166011 RepID=A0A915E3T5_9BILA